MPKLNNKTKAKILQAAEQVFHENGFKGARTTLIAQRAGISRTMLHYYFSTKEDLFQEVVRESFGYFIQYAQKLFDQGEHDLKTMIEKLVDTLYEALSQKPSLPSFVVNILNESPTLLTDIPFIQEEQLPLLIEKKLEEAREIHSIDPGITGEDLLLHIYGMCVMPFLGIPLIKFKENRSNEEMKAFLEKRKQNIKAFLWRGILSQNANVNL